MDKMLAFIIIFLGISILMAAILAMGAVPKIFQSAEKINQTQELVNQTQIQIHEDQAREQQKSQIIKETNKSINILQDNLTELMIDSQKRSEKGQSERQTIINEILNVSKQHDKVAKDHDRMQKGISNVTNYIQKELERYGENSIKQFNQILDNQETLIELLTSLNNKTK